MLQPRHHDGRSRRAIPLAVHPARAPRIPDGWRALALLSRAHPATPTAGLSSSRDCRDRLCGADCDVLVAGGNSFR